MTKACWLRRADRVNCRQARQGPLGEKVPWGSGCLGVTSINNLQFVSAT